MPAHQEKPADIRWDETRRMNISFELQQHIVTRLSFVLGPMREGICMQPSSSVVFLYSVYRAEVVYTPYRDPGTWVWIDV